MVEEVEVEEVDEYLVSFEELEGSQDLESKIADYQALLSNPRYDDAAVKIKEQCIYRLARLYTEGKRFDDVMALLRSNNELFGMIPKAKTAKIVRNILNIVATVPDSLDVQVSLCQDVCAWCVAEKRTFLRQRIEGKLASLLLQQNKATEALTLIDKLLVELKKLDDKQMLTEAHLTEARIYHNLQNVPKAKSSLTASRSSANAIYVVPLLQAEIDEMSGVLHCEEGDYTTAYSYFLEAFEGYDQSSAAPSQASAKTILKYMVLAKVLNGAPAEVPSILSSKHGMKHAFVGLEALAAIAKAAKARSLEDFQAAVTQYEPHLRHDALISHHLDVLYDKMLEGNLLKIISPYSVVEIAHIANKIRLPETTVVHKLSQMILDHKFFGILEQGRGHLIIYESAEGDGNFSKGVEIIANMGSVVEALFSRARGLTGKEEKKREGKEKGGKEVKKEKKDKASS
ncbi:hypothetical protein B484DRAFT_337157 [Ochromonadaceae sp. CCMP2298]|nr:hypothetical protein B484DRAFT_337157 [Ochromonadaceae sp. CCMP2298]